MDILAWTSAMGVVIITATQCLIIRVQLIPKSITDYATASAWAAVNQKTNVPVNLKKE
jgi:hypothetical protein